MDRFPELRRIGYNTTVDSRVGVKDKETMTRDQDLPPEVPADNGTPGAAGPAASAEFKAPDMATPAFSNDVRSLTPPALSESKSDSAARGDMMSRDYQNLVLMISIVTLAVAIGGILLLRAPKDPMPPCAEQPEWNQYNCRAG